MTGPLAHLWADLHRHCWHEGPADFDAMTCTCMLPAGHGGAHVYTRDDLNRFEVTR
jgi:hypothetical protein